MRDRQEEPLTKESFAELYTRFRPLMLKVARRFFPRNPAEAEETVQEAFARAWKFRHKYQPGPDVFQKWLWTITKNTALAYLQQRQSRRREVAFSLLRAYLPEDVADSSPLPDERVINEELFARLELVLAGLSPDDKFLLMMRTVEGESFKAIGQILGRYRKVVARRHVIILKKVTRRLLGSPRTILEALVDE